MKNLKILKLPQLFKIGRNEVLACILCTAWLIYFTLYAVFLHPGFVHHLTHNKIMFFQS